MTFTRLDGRKPDELRELDAKVGIIPRADGSAMFKMGKTIAIAAVYGPKELYPKFLQDSTKGVLRCSYSMMAFSGSGGERVRPGPSRRSKEISWVTENALNSALDLSKYAKSVINVNIQLLQTDAGTRCAGICAAALALADAGIPMRDMVGAVAVGLYEGHPIVDLTKEEEDVEGAVDLAVAMLSRSKKLSLVQMDGKIEQETMKKVLKLAEGAIDKIYVVQKKALLEKYGGSGNE